VEVGRGRVGGAPGGVEAGLGGTLDAEEIYAPDGGGVERGDQAFHGEGDFRQPNLLLLIHGDAATQAALQVLPFAMGDIQIDPHAVGADFEFLVALRIGGVRAEEDFGYVTIPETVATAIGFGVGKGGYGAKVSVEFDEEGFARPEEADLGGALGVGILALPVGAEA